MKKINISYDCPDIDIEEAFLIFSEATDRSEDVYYGHDALELMLALACEFGISDPDINQIEAKVTDHFELLYEIRDAFEDDEPDMANYLGIKGIRDLYDYGKFLLEGPIQQVPLALRPYIDFEEYGSDHASKLDYIFTEYKYEPCMIIRKQKSHT